MVCPQNGTAVLWGLRKPVRAGFLASDGLKYYFLKRRRMPAYSKISCFWGQGFETIIKMQRKKRVVGGGGGVFPLVGTQEKSE